MEKLGDGSFGELDGEPDRQANRPLLHISPRNSPSAFFADESERNMEEDATTPTVGDEIVATSADLQSGAKAPFEEVALGNTISSSTLVPSEAAGAGAKIKEGSAEEADSSPDSESTDYSSSTSSSDSDSMSEGEEEKKQGDAKSRAAADYYDPFRDYRRKEDGGYESSDRSSRASDYFVDDDDSSSSDNRRLFEAAKQSDKPKGLFGLLPTACGIQ